MGYFEELINNLEEENMNYAVFAGYAFEGLRGKITRSHEDVDIYFLKKDFEILQEIFNKLGYKQIEHVNELYSFKKDDFKVDACLLEKDGDNLISKVRLVTLIFPKELFFEPQKGMLNHLEFNVVKNELLKFCVHPQREKDVEFAEELIFSSDIYDKVQVIKHFKKS